MNPVRQNSIRYRAVGGYTLGFVPVIVGRHISRNRINDFREAVEGWKRYDNDNYQGFEAVERLSSPEKAQKILQFLDFEELERGHRCWEYFELAKDFRNHLEHAKTQSWSEHPDERDDTPRTLVDRLAELRARENPILHSSLGAGGIEIRDDMPMLERFVSSEYGEWVVDSSFLFLKAFLEGADLDRDEG